LRSRTLRRSLAIVRCLITSLRARNRSVPAREASREASRIGFRTSRALWPKPRLSDRRQRGNRAASHD